jgi:hypothetical protein
MTTDLYHMVSVPDKDLFAVYALLAERNATGNSPTPGATADPPDETFEVPGNNGRWSRGDLTELHTRCHARNRAILTCIAEAGVNGSEATYRDLLEAGRPFASEPVRYVFNNLRADLAWIAKYCIKVKGSNVWPFTFRHVVTEHADGEHLLYNMPLVVAQWWLEIPE